GLEDADRLARLDQQALVVTETLQRGDDRLEALPVPGGLADAAVDHELRRVLGNLRIEVVHEHPQRRLGEPAARAEPVAAGRPDGAGEARSWCRGVHPGSSMERAARGRARPGGTPAREIHGNCGDGY